MMMVTDLYLCENLTATAKIIRVSYYEIDEYMPLTMIAMPMIMLMKKGNH